MKNWGDNILTAPSRRKSPRREAAEGDGVGAGRSPTVFMSWALADYIKMDDGQRRLKRSSARRYETTSVAAVGRNAGAELKH